MRKILFLFLCSFALFNGSFAQKLSDQQVIQMAVKEKQAGASETEIATPVRPADHEAWHG